MEAIERVLDRARQGNAEALSALYHRFLPGIFGSIARLRARDEAGFLAWLLRIARVAVAEYYRKHAKQPVHLSLQGEDWQHLQAGSLAQLSSSPEDDPVSWAQGGRTGAWEARPSISLTEEQRQALVGRLILGYDVATRYVLKKELEKWKLFSTLKARRNSSTINLTMPP